jgi:hypothetical protein
VDPTLGYSVQSRTTDTGLLGTDGVTLSGALARASGENVGTAYAINQGTLTTGSNNYSINYTGANFAITARPITITANADQTKIYGNVDPTLGYSVEALGANRGLVGSDTFAGTLSRASGENVGSTYAIGQGTVANSNYAITFVPANFAITARPITITANADQTKIYGNVDPTLGYSVEALGANRGLVGSDTFAGTLSRASGENVGSTYAIGQGTVANSNYAITFVPANFAITARPITITANADQTKIYGNVDPTLGYSVQSRTTDTGLLGTDGVTLSGALARASGENVGTAYAINQGTLTTGSNNYSINYTGANFAITARPITLSASAATKVYGQADPSLAVTITAGSLASVAVTDSLTSVTGTLTRSLGENVGNYNILLGSGAKAGNYLITFDGLNRAFGVSKADLTISPIGGQSKNYGQSDPTFTYSVTGLINNLVVSDTNPSAVISGALSRASGETIGTYAFTADGMAASNYNIRVVSSPASFTVLPAPIGIVISGSYSGTQTITPSNFSVTGLAFGQTISSISSAVVNDPNVASNGSNYVTSVIGVAGSALMSNYYITARYNGTPNTNTTNIVTITPATLTIAAANDAKFVTQSDVLASANNCGASSCAGGYMGLTFNGFVNGETKDVLGGAPAIIRTNSAVNGAGVYNGVLQPSGYSSSNYIINYANGDYVIAPANSLLVRVNPTSTTFGTAPTYNATAAYLTSDERTIVNLTPSISGSTISISDGVGGGANFDLSMVGANLSSSRNINVGGYNLAAVNPSVSGSNFNSLMVVGSATVKPFTLNPDQLGITTLSKVYDGNINIGGLVINTNPILSRVLGSGAAKDQVTILGSGIFTDNPNVGTGKNVTVALSLSGADGNNYVLSSNSYSAPIGTIAQLDSVNYIGAPGGKWSTQTNWAGGAIPNLNNVATAIIPVGYSVVYDASVVGSIGSIIQNNGTVSFNETAPFNLGNTLAGSGVFAQSGSGALTISGNNSQVSPGAFTGQFSIAPGSTLLFANANALGAGSINSNNGSFGLTSGTTLANLIISGPVNLVSNIATVGSQNYGGPVTLAYGNQTTEGAMHISSQDADIAFTGTLNSDSANRSLTIDAGLGKVTFNDTVGYLSPDHNHKSADISSLIVNAKDINLLADVSTLNQQLYNGAVVVGDNGNNGLIRKFISQDPSVTFGGTVDDSSAVTHTLDVRAVSYSALQSPTISFIGPIGSIVPLGALSVTTQTILPPLNPADPPVILPSGVLTLGGNVTTVGGQNFSTGGVTLQPTPGNTITLNSQQGTVQFVGTPAGVVADLNRQVTVLNNSAPTTPTPAQNGNASAVMTFAGTIPPLYPSEEQFLIAGLTSEARVWVGSDDLTHPCEVGVKNECTRN